MKTSKAKTRSRVHKIPRLRFDRDKKLTAYGGLVLIQALIAKLDLKKRLSKLRDPSADSTVYGMGRMILLLVVSILIGCRRLRDLDYCREDALLTHVTGLRRLPDISTLSRMLSEVGNTEKKGLRAILQEDVLQRIQTERFERITADFDGSVLSTCGHAEGTAVGYNPQKKGARRYYPLFCTIAQTDPFFDMLHRPGNVHDSNGAAEFIQQCMCRLSQTFPTAQLETRLDSAFFDELLFLYLREYDVEFSCSVPFARYPQLKKEIEGRVRWTPIDKTWSCFEKIWQPKGWIEPYRFLFVRQRKRVRTKGPLQLDLFEPRDHEYDYPVIVTNRIGSAQEVISFHHGRGCQEKLFGHGKQHAALDVFIAKRQSANEIFTLSAMYAHNLSRELQMATRRPDRAAQPSRAAQWKFSSLGTLRQRLFHRAGVLSRPQGELTLTLNANESVENDFLTYLSALAPS